MLIFLFADTRPSHASVCCTILLLIRRLHDLGRTGWFWLLIWFPFVNLALLVYAFCFKGTTGPNRFGPDPLA